MFSDKIRITLETLIMYFIPFHETFRLTSLYHLRKDFGELTLFLTALRVYG